MSHQVSYTLQYLMQSGGTASLVTIISLGLELALSMSSRGRSLSGIFSNRASTYQGVTKNFESQGSSFQFHTEADAVSAPPPPPFGFGGGGGGG